MGAWGATAVGAISANGCIIGRKGSVLLRTAKPAVVWCLPDAKPCRSCPGTVLLALLASSLLPVVSKAAQKRSQAPFSVRVETQLVQVRVQIVGRDGKPAIGLKKSDFIVKENGRRRQVETLDYVPTPGPVSKVSRMEQAARTAGQASRRHAWIYIDSEIEPNEVPEAYQAIRKFLATQLQPDFMVSLDGLPFTDDRAKLMAVLEKMHQHPYGRLPEVPPLINSTLDMEKQADYEWLLYSALLWGGGATAPPPGFAGFTLRPGLPRGGRADAVMNQADVKLEMQETEREMSFYVRSALFRYLDIIYRLESLQGEKFVVLFRSGLRTDPESMQLLHEFAADAMRHQIAFYTVDTRGPINIDPTTNRAKLLRYGVAIPMTAMGAGFQMALNDYTRTEELENGRTEGLIDIAKLTGGRSVTGTNEFQEVFTDVVEDASGYYVIGFYPADGRQDGRFRRLKISVYVPEASVYAPKGYYEPRPFQELSKREKEIVLWQALKSEMPRDLNVAASVNVFRGENGQPVAVVSSGVRLGSLGAKRKENISEFHVTELAEIGAVSGGSMPIYHGRVASVKVANAVLSRASAIPTEFLTFNASLPVAPGKHLWKVMFRDDSTGKLGAEEVRFDAPDYGEAPSASTLLVTHHVSPISAESSAGKADGAPGNLAGLLQAGSLDFVPQPDAAFHSGDEIYLLYELYNPPSYDFNALAASTRTQLFLDGRPIRQFNINWRILPNRQSRLAILIGKLDTSHYVAGEYQVVQSVPVEIQANGKLVATFTLLQN